MDTLSLCLIVRNEAEVLARCLESAAGLYDELVVVDTGSEDETRAIARRFTGQVYDFPWRDDFSAARNFSFDQAHMSYCMWLDADDVLLPADRAAFLELKRDRLPGPDVVMAPYHAGVDEAGRPVLTYYRERILRRVPELRWEGAVHEAVTPRGAIVYTQAAVTHRKERPSDPERNLRILEHAAASGRNLTPREQFYYGRELSAHGRYAEAVRVLEDFLTVGWGWKENNIEACRTLGACYEALGNPRHALRALLESLAFDPPRAEVCCDLGRLWMERNDYAQAARWYEQALDCPWDLRSGAFCIPDCHGFLPCIQLCVCAWNLGERERAVYWNERAAAFRPDHPVCRQNRAFFAGEMDSSQENASKREDSGK